ncbi:MAG: hypothetical protein WC593_07470 [Methanoregula sp.]
MKPPLADFMIVIKKDYVFLSGAPDLSWGYTIQPVSKNENSPKDYYARSGKCRQFTKVKL